MSATSIHSPLASLRPYLLAGLGALMAVAAFPKWDAWPLILVCLAPLRLASRGAGWRRAAALGWTWGTLTALGLCYWIQPVVANHGGLPDVVAAGVVLLLAGALGLYPALWAALTATAPPGPAACLVGALLWAGLEWVRGWFLSGFPWCDLGYALLPVNAAVQAADLGGVGLIGFMVVLTNLALADAVRPGPSGRPWRGLVLAAAVWAALMGYGQWSRSAWDEEARLAPRLAVRVVQGNVEQSEKWDLAFREQSLKRYRELSLAPGQPRPELVVWPETAAPFFFEDDSPHRRRLLDLARELDAWLVFGAPAYETRQGRTTYLNRAWALSPRGEVAGHMDKAHLVPYGEYVPMKSWFPFLGTAVPQIGEYEPGPDGRVLHLGRIRLGALICYESIFPELSRAHAENGATLLANLTNDSWFGQSSAPFQHLAMLTMRAVEQRRAVARAAQNGISALIGPDGRILARLELNRAGQLTADLPNIDKKTIYTRYGHLFGPGALLLALVAAYWRARRGRDAADPGE